MSTRTAVGPRRYDPRGAVDAGPATLLDALDVELGRPVLIDRYADPAVAATVRASARRLANHDHPAVARVLDSYDVPATEPGGPAVDVVLNRPPGPTLQDVVASGDTGLAAVASLGAEVADALDHLHGIGLAHQRLRPVLVHLPPDGTAQVVGVDLAHALAAGAPDGRALADARALAALLAAVAERLVEQGSPPPPPAWGSTIEQLAAGGLSLATASARLRDLAPSLPATRRPVPGTGEPAARTDTTASVEPTVVLGAATVTAAASPWRAGATVPLPVPLPTPPAEPVTAGPAPAGATAVTATDPTARVGSPASRTTIPTGTAPPVPPLPVGAPRRRRRALRALVGALLVLAVLAGGLALGWAVGSRVLGGSDGPDPSTSSVPPTTAPQTAPASTTPTTTRPPTTTPPTTAATTTTTAAPDTTATTAPPDTTATLLPRKRKGKG